MTSHRLFVEIFNGAGIRKAADSIHSIADGSHAIAPELRLVSDDTVEMKWISPLRHTNAWPRCRQWHASLMATKALTC